MGKVIVCMLLALLIFNGCAHNIFQLVNESDDEFFQRVENLCKQKDELTIQTTNYRLYMAKDLKIASDTTSFIEKGTNLIKIKNTKEISSISFSQKGRGAYEGFLYGTLIGASTGLGIELLGLDKESAAPKGNVYTIIYSSITGGILGIMYGIVDPSTTTIIIK